MQLITCVHTPDVSPEASIGAGGRLILEPTLASRLAGDFRTGKRLNMRRVIAFVASQFRKDKIWMRRTRPDKRKYQVRSGIVATQLVSMVPMALEATDGGPCYTAAHCR